MLHPYKDSTPYLVSSQLKSRMFDLLRVALLLETDSGYPKDAEVTWFTLANPGNPLRFVFFSGIAESYVNKDLIVFFTNQRDGPKNW